jgi:hypothetical protein
MRCPNCGSDRVNVQAVAENKKRGLLMSILWILLSFITIGIFLLIAVALTKKGSKIRTWALCQNCGYRWEVPKTGTSQRPALKEPSIEGLISNIQKALEHKLKKRVDISEDKSAWSVTKEGLTYSLKSQIKVDGVSKDAHIKIYFPDNTYSNFFFSGIQLDGNDMLHR